jgi:CxxC-x17-CxxC domain-containing protein
MDEEKIFVMNLSKGRIGEDNSALLGAMLITRLQLAAMSRIDIAEEARKDFYLYVDEFQNFATESFATILSEARKYRLDLILAHQYITQMVEPVRDAVFGNVGTMIIFRVGGYDAEFIEKEFEPEFTVNDLVGLGFAQIYLKLMIDGMASRPFSATTLPPFPKPEVSYKETIIKISRERYSTSRSEVEEKIAKWSGVIKSEEEERKTLGKEISPAHRAEFHEPLQPLFDAVCNNCGRKIQVKFKPDGVRPVYCKDCLTKIREQGMDQPASASRSPNSRFRPQDQRPSGEILIKDTGEPISLAQAAGKEPAKFSDSRRKKKEVNLSELRETLQEVLKNEEEDNEEKEKKSDLVLDGNAKRNREKKPENSNGEVLNEGENVEL